MHILSLCLVSLLAFGNAYAASLTLQSPRFTISSSDATQLRAEPISITKKASPLTLGPTDVLKLTFQVVDDVGNSVQPHQTFLRFYDEATGEEGIQPVRVTAGGKAKFELNMSRPPTSLPPSTTLNPLKVSLLIGSFVHSPLRVELFDLHIPASHPPPQHPDEASFHPLPTIHHTFQPEPKLPPMFISAFFAGLVVAPWFVLLGLWGSIQPRVPHLFSPKIFPFVTTLGAFEALLFWYWVDLKLGQVLFYGAILSIPTLIAGQQALSAMVKRRLGTK